MFVVVAHEASWVEWVTGDMLAQSDDMLTVDHGGMSRQSLVTHAPMKETLKKPG